MHRQTGNYVTTAYRKGEKGGTSGAVLRRTCCRSQGARAYRHATGDKIYVVT